VAHLDLKVPGLRGAVLGVLLWMLPGSARAQDAVDLSWEAPAECPQREAVQQRVRELAGPALQNAERLRAEGRIVQVDKRYQLTLTVHEKGEARERTMASHSCVDLVGAAAVALGLLIRQGPASPAPTGTDAPGPPPGTEPGERGSSTNQGTTTRSTAPAAAAASKPAQAGATEKGAPDDDTSTDPETPEPTTSDSTYSSDSSIPGALNAHFLLRVPLAVMDVGPLPNPGFGVGGALGLRSGGWRVSVAGRILLSQTWLQPGSVDLGAEVKRWQAELWLCRGWRFRHTELSPCLTVALDRLSATGTGPGVQPSTQKSLSFVAGLAGTAHVYVMDSMAIFASLALGIETTRPVFVVDGLGTIGQVGATQVSVGLGPEWIF
jgi:hypothetical protein